MGYIEQLKPYIGQCELDKVNILSLQPFITQRRQDGVKSARSTMVCRLHAEF